MFYKEKSKPKIYSLDELRVKFIETSFPEEGPDYEWLRDNNFSKVEGPVVEPEPVDMKLALANHRYFMETSGVNLGGVLVQTDRDARSNLIGAYLRAMQDPNYTVRWKTADGFITLSAAQIIAASNAASDHVKKCFETEEIIEGRIDSYVSVQAMIVDFNTELGIQI